MSTQITYQDYYQRTIDHHQMGLKLVLGGTGLGKTSGIVGVVSNPTYQDRKFIYCANRNHLLEEMAKDLSKKGVLFVFLRRDLEIVQRVLREKRADFNALLNDQLFQNQLYFAKQSDKYGQVDIAKVRQACRFF